MEAPKGTITQHLEGFLLSARKLEDALGEEKKRSQKIAQEYLATRTTLENAVRELQNRLIQRENKIQAITSAFQNHQTMVDGLKNEIREISEREKKYAAELSQYKGAWNEVLARETHARNILLEFEKSKNLLNEQRNQIKQMENKLQETNQNAATHSRHAETYQRELQSALIRIQSADAKYSQIQKELSILSQNKRNADEEIARIEASMKERFRWELAAEKERLRAEIEKDSALDRERFREVARNQMRTEIERQTAPDRRAREAAESELAQTRNQLSESESKRAQETERARARILALTDENLILKNEIRDAVTANPEELRMLTDRLERSEKNASALKNELAMHQMESGNAQILIENLRKDSNKALLVERLRQEDQIRDLHRKIEELITHGVYAEKIDSAPEGVKIYSATPVRLVISNVQEAVSESVMTSN